METDNHELKDQLIIRSNGLEGSLRTKKEEDDGMIYFGYSNEEDTVNQKLFYLYY